MQWWMIGALANAASSAAVGAVTAARRIARRSRRRRPGTAAAAAPRTGDAIDGPAERRRQALMIHDDVVQKLVTAKLSLELGEFDAGLVALEETLDAARRITSELYDGFGREDLSQALRRPAAATGDGH